MISWFRPGSSSSGRNVRPRSGCTPIIGKKLAVTWKSWTFCASRSPVRFTSSHAYAASSSNECTSFFQSRYVAGATGVRSWGPKPAPPSLATRESTRATIRSEFSNGTGCSRNASARLNIAVFAPIPRPNATTQTIVAIRCLINIRKPNRTSCQIVSMNCLPGSGSDARFLRFLDNASVEQMNVALGKIRVTLVVRDHADGRAVAVQIAQQLHDRLAVLRIEVSGRLVSHQNERIANQRARHGDTLLLTARELRRVVAQPVSHSDAFQRVLYLLLPFRSACAAIRQRQLDVLIHRQVPDQVERLENKSNLAVADSRAFADREIRHRLSVQRILAARRRIEKSKNREQCRFAAARRPRNRDVLPLLDLQVNFGQGMRLDLIRIKHFLHAFHLDECCVCVRHSLSFSSAISETRFTSTRSLCSQNKISFASIHNAAPRWDLSASLAAMECSTPPEPPGK